MRTPDNKLICVFRGFTAAASLKDVIFTLQRDIGALQGFPRFHRRGLIEGFYCEGAMFQIQNHVFRGFTAAASLKDGREVEPEYWMHRFSAVSPPRPH